MASSRYPNMDLIWAFAVQGFVLLLIIVSYDIVCQWFVNLFERMARWPKNLQINPSTTVRAVIPKLHIRAHQDKGHAQHCINWTKGGAQCDCEGPERIWMPHNPLGNSTKSQGPGTRHDNLDCHFAFWNWQKYIGMGTSTCASILYCITDVLAGTTLRKNTTPLSLNVTAISKPTVALLRLCRRIKWLHGRRLLKNGMTTRRSPRRP